MPYLPNIPAAGDKLVVSQGQIQGNFQTSNTVFGTDHYPFDNVSGNEGKHKQVQMPVLLAKPAGLSTGEGTLYSKTANSESQIFFNPDNSVNEYQLTRAIDAEFAKFAKNTPYLANSEGGWTFLPGGLILQYGKRQSAANPSAVVFPVAFTSVPFSVTATRIQNTATSWGITVPTTTGFSLTNAGGGSSNDFFWFAIGI